MMQRIDRRRLCPSRLSPLLGLTTHFLGRLPENRHATESQALHATEADTLRNFLERLLSVLDPGAGEIQPQALNGYGGGRSGGAE